MKQMLIKLDMALTGLPESMARTNCERQGSRLLNGDFYFLSDGWSRIFWRNGHLNLWADSIPYVKENWLNLQEQIQAVEQGVREAVHAS